MSLELTKKPLNKQLTEGSNSPPQNIAFLSTYPPRECGIATFTKDLLDAIDKLEKKFSLRVIAMNEKGAIYNYDRRVKWTIDRDLFENYSYAADKLSSSNIDLINIQHEFGIFGGAYGEFLDEFLSNVEQPVVTTLHTVQPDFDSKALLVLKKIIDKSAAVVVIAHKAKEILKQQGISNKKFFVIPHGSPFVPYVESDSVKSSLDMKGRFVICTFGLISRNKGIEYVIKALPEVIEKIPNLLYVVVGETHPEVRKYEGEKYRKKLLQLVCDLGLEKHVRFHNRFLSKRELIKYLQATDVYVTPYVTPNQISSGTLTYALGAGRAVISTPYLHAQEVLADGRGLFCKFKDAASISDCLIRLSDTSFRKKMEAKVYKYSKRFIWENVATKYTQLFNKIIK